MEQVESIGVEELEKMASRMYGALVKAVVDVRLGRVVVDAELHYDEEQYLLETQRSRICGASISTPTAMEKKTSSSSIP